MLARFLRILVLLRRAKDREIRTVRRMRRRMTAVVVSISVTLPWGFGFDNSGMKVFCFSITPCKIWFG